MSTYSGPEIASSGLTVAYDMNNPDRSWKGVPTTNLLYDNGVFNTYFLGLTSDLATANLSSNMIRLTIGANYPAFPGSTYSSTIRLMVPAGKLANNQQYTVSYKYKTISGTDSFTVGDFSDGFLSSNSTTTYSDYKYFYGVTSSGQTFTDVFRFIDFNVTGNTIVDIWDIQLENKTYPTPFINGTRSNANSIIDLTGTNTLTSNNLTYSSNNIFSFNGTNNFITISNTNGSVSPNTVTIEAWVNHTNTAQNISFVGGMGDTGYSGYWLGKNSGYWYGNSANGTTLVQISSGVLATSNTNTHLALTYDGTTTRIYVNGTLASSSTAVSGNLNYSGSPTAYIGNITGLSADRYWTGNIYVYKVYNRALTATEIRQNFYALRGRFGI